MTTQPKRVSLQFFAKRYSHANQSELDILDAALKKLDTHSEAYRLAEAEVKARKEFFDYLDAAGFEL